MATMTARGGAAGAPRNIEGGDRRAAETADELVDALAERAAAVARLETCLPGTRERAVAQIEVDYLRVLIIDLERTLAERPWTEAT